MKIKNKGKVHPSPSSSSSSSFSSSSIHGDCFAVLKLLPSAILTLISVLSFEESEVLAYMITRSLHTTTTTPARIRSSTSFVVHDSKNKKKRSSEKHTASCSHKPPVFECDCFDCYTGYWIRWDSSPNRELIHQAIEAFDDHLTNGEAEKSKKNGKRREKSGRRIMDRPDPPVSRALSHLSEIEEESLPDSVVSSEDSLGNDVRNAISPEKVSDSGEDAVSETPVVMRSEAGCVHKGLARKVLPDVLGLFNSRLWNLWNPNV